MWDNLKLVDTKSVPFENSFSNRKSHGRMYFYGSITTWDDLIHSVYKSKHISGYFKKKKKRHEQKDAGLD